MTVNFGKVILCSLCSIIKKYKTFLFFFPNSTRVDITVFQYEKCAKLRARGTVTDMNKPGSRIAVISVIKF